MPKFSIIVCISNPNVFEECLLRSININRKDIDIEIVPIVNRNNIYSASNALNVGIDASKSDILIFAHQDVRLLDDWFVKLDGFLQNISDDWGIIGSAGIAIKYNREDIGKWGGSLYLDTVAVGTVYDNDESLEKGVPYWNGTKDLEQVHCVDECIFVMNKRTGLRFDSMYTGFHFYGVDMCMQARAAGYGVYGADLPIVHYGKYSASITGDHKYWVYYRYLHYKWHERFPELLGTHMHWAKGELTSYISIGLENDIGQEITIQAMGIERARFKREFNKI